MSQHQLISVKTLCKVFWTTQQQIAYQILDYLDVEDLFNVRLVCRQWEWISRPLIAERTVVCLGNLEQIESYIETYRFNPYLFNQYIITGKFSFTTSMYTLFATFGPYMTKLKIYGCSWIGTELSTILENTPNILDLTIVGTISPKERLYRVGFNPRSCWLHLMSLTINLQKHSDFHPSDYTYNDDLHDGIQTFLTQILTCCPNLSTIRTFGNLSLLRKTTLVHKNNFDTAFVAYLFGEVHAEPKTDFGGTGFAKLLIQTILFKDNIYLPKLSVIDVPSNMTLFDTEIQSLEMKQFPLTHLVLVVQPQIGLATLHSLLKSLALTLTRLNLGFMDCERATAHFFPSSQYLVHLTHLCLSRFQGPVNFLENFVSLKEVHLFEACLHNTFMNWNENNIILPVGFTIEYANLAEASYRLIRKLQL